MTTVTVVVPWRGGCEHRERAWEWVRGWWRRQHPDWQVIAGLAPDGPWCKAAAVAHGARGAAGQILVVADADVVCPGVGDAAQHVAAGQPWAVPHRGVYRLTRDATERLRQGDDLPTPGTRLRATGQVSEIYRGVPGGGLVVLPAETLERVPLDARFLGWGQEDTAWAHALTLLAGPPWRGQAPLFHLWHPPQPRITRGVGSAEGLALHRAYRSTYLPEAMRDLLDGPGVRMTTVHRPPPPGEGLTGCCRRTVFELGLYDRFGDLSVNCPGPAVVQP